MQTSQRNYKNYSYQSHQRILIAQRRRRPPFRAVVIVALVFFVGIIGKGVFAMGDKQPTENHKAVLSQKSEEKPVVVEKPKKVVDTSTLKPALDQIIKKYPYDTSVSVVELNSGVLVQSGDSYPYLAASTTKILTALAYMERVEGGKAKLSDKVAGVNAGEQMQKMINQSDNDAWHSLNDYLSKNALSSYAKAHGLNSYDPVRNVVNSNDMALLLAKLYKRELINDEHTKLLLSWMQNTSEEKFIPPAIPGGTALYHKAGYLADRAHDVAIVDNGSTPYVVVIYSKSYGPNYNFQSGQKLFKETITRIQQTFVP